MREFVSKEMREVTKRRQQFWFFTEDRIDEQRRLFEQLELMAWTSGLRNKIFFCYVSTDQDVRSFERNWMRESEAGEAHFGPLLWRGIGSNPSRLSDDVMPRYVEWGAWNDQNDTRLQFWEDFNEYALELIDFLDERIFPEIERVKLSEDGLTRGQIRHKDNLLWNVETHNEQDLLMSSTRDNYCHIYVLHGDYPYQDNASNYRRSDRDWIYESEILAFKSHWQEIQVNIQAKLRENMNKIALFWVQKYFH